MTDEITWPTDEIRDLALQLRAEQAHSWHVTESIIHQLANLVGDIPRSKKPVRLESPFRKPENRSKTNRK